LPDTFARKSAPENTISRFPGSNKPSETDNRSRIRSGLSCAPKRHPSEVERAAHGVRAHVICPGFVRTPLVERQLPEQARELGLTEDQVVTQVMLRETVDGGFTTVGDVADVAVFFAAFPSLALTGQSLLVSHGWHMQ
jgi:hypothetical protein